MKYILLAKQHYDKATYCKPKRLFTTIEFDELIQCLRKKVIKEINHYLDDYGMWTYGFVYNIYIFPPKIKIDAHGDGSSLSNSNDYELSFFINKTDSDDYSDKQLSILTAILSLNGQDMSFDQVINKLKIDNEPFLCRETIKGRDVPIPYVCEFNKSTDEIEPLVETQNIIEATTIEEEIKPMEIIKPTEEHGYVWGMLKYMNVV